MKKALIFNMAVLFGLVLFMGTTPTKATDQTFVTIGTGGVTGVYYPTGGAICSMLSKTRKDHGIRCSLESTGGSVYNLNTIAAGELDMGVVQSDWQHHAYYGTSKFKDKGPNKDLRAVFSIYSEPFTVLVRKDSGIKNFQDLKGKRVNIGNPGSGQRGTMEVVMKALGWTKADFKLASELKSTEQAKALCDNKIDAMVFTVGHPSGSIKEVTSSCDSMLINVTGPEIDKLVKDNDYYKVATIPGGMYRGTATDTKTFGVSATLVTSNKVPDKVIYNVTKAVFENFDQFKKLHPSYAALNKESMLAGLSAPIHSGAARYYLEKNLAQHPEFPWPLPPSSASNKIPAEFFRKPVGETLYLHDVEQRILEALNSAGYHEKSYYSVPGGFAMVTRLEQINYDGTSKEGRHRWQTKIIALPKLTFKQYIQALFKANKGLFRVIVFILTPHPFSQTGLKVSREKAIEWLNAGLNVLPSSIGDIEYSKKYNCHALIYEFEKLSTDKAAKIIVPGYLEGRTHLVKAKLWSYWEK